MGARLGSVVSALDDVDSTSRLAPAESRLLPPVSRDGQLSVELLADVVDGAGDAWTGGRAGAAAGAERATGDELLGRAGAAAGGAAGVDDALGAVLRAAGAGVDTRGTTGGAGVAACVARVLLPVVSGGVAVMTGSGVGSAGAPGVSISATVPSTGSGPPSEEVWLAGSAAGPFCRMAM